jgi:hypothetical protein
VLNLLYKRKETKKKRSIICHSSVIPEEGVGRGLKEGISKKPKEKKKMNNFPKREIGKIGERKDGNPLRKIVIFFRHEEPRPPKIKN